MVRVPLSENPTLTLSYTSTQQTIELSQWNHVNLNVVSIITWRFNHSSTLVHSTLQLNHSCTLAIAPFGGTAFVLSPAVPEVPELQGFVTQLKDFQARAEPCANKATLGDFTRLATLAYTCHPVYS